MRALAPLLLVVASLLPGCTAPVISGAVTLAEYGTSTFNSGSLETYYPNTFEDTVVAVRRTISDLGLRPVDDVPKDDEGFLYLKVMDETGEQIWIRVRRRGDRLTMIRIRVGVLGDEPYSTALTRHVTDLLDPDKQLSTPPPNLRKPTARPYPKTAQPR